MSVHYRFPEGVDRTGLPSAETVARQHVALMQHQMLKAYAARDAWREVSAFLVGYSVVLTGLLLWWRP